MTKKNFKKGFSGLLGEEPYTNKDTTPFTESISSARDIVKEKRATFIVRTEQLDALKAIAFWERRLLKDILREALSSYIFNYEKNNGKIKYPE